MKKIITAMGNSKINEELRSKDCNVVSSDIQYQEGVIEMLENSPNIDILILNSILPGEKDLKSFIDRIIEISVKIQIIIILEKENLEIKNFLISRGIFNIFYDNQITVEEIMFLVKENKIPNEINEEIRLLKEMILNNKVNKKGQILKNIKNIANKAIKSVISNRNRRRNFLKGFSNVSEEEVSEGNDRNKVISIVGAYGTGKTMISYILANIVKDKKVLLIDFDVINNNISTLFGTNRLPKESIENIRKKRLNINQISINDAIIRVNNNLDLICEMDLILKNEKEKNEIKSIVNKLTQKYDLIISDTPADANNNNLKPIMESSDCIVLTVIPNLLGVKSAQKLLEIYINKWGIKKEEIRVLFNKNHSGSIEELILNSLFSDFNSLGKLKLDGKYDSLINGRGYMFDKRIKKEFFRIIDKLNVSS